MTKLESDVEPFFRGRNFAFLATVNRDGTPQVTPVWVDTDGELILVNTAMGRLKVRNVDRDPRVGISVVDHENPYHRVSLYGRVVEKVEGEQAEEHIDSLAFKYTGEKKYKKSSPDERRVILKIRPERVFHVVS